MSGGAEGAGGGHEMSVLGLGSCDFWDWRGIVGRWKIFDLAVENNSVVY